MRDRVRAVSKEFVGAPIYDASGADLTSDTVELCFTTGDNAPTVWTAGQWVTAGGAQWAVVLIGPGSTFGPLAPGRYWVNVRITDSPEIPVLTAPNQLVIY